MAVTHRRGLVVGARSFPSNPYDGHTLAEQLEQTRSLLQGVGVEPKAVIVDVGYRGVDDVVSVDVIQRGKSKTLAAQQRRWLHRRQASRRPSDAARATMA